MSPELARAFEETRIIVKASESWADSYKQHPDTLGKLIKTEARLERKMLGYFKDMADANAQFINWPAYNSMVRTVKASKHPLIQAYEVEVIVEDDGVDEFDGLFITMAFEEVLTATTLGAVYGENEYDIPLGISSVHEAMQIAAKDHVATLVGKKIDKNGLIIDNPNAKYTISDETRRKIRQSITTSLSLGEDLETARKRLSKTIKDPKRALTIAQTESVNAFQSGLDEFGVQSGAIGKESQDNNSLDYCAIYAELGPVPFDYLYGGKYRGPSYHPRCRCGKRLIYQIELDRNPKLFG